MCGGCRCQIDVGEEDAIGIEHATAVAVASDQGDGSTVGRGDGLREWLANCDTGVIGVGTVILDRGGGKAPGALCGHFIGIGFGHLGPPKRRPRAFVAFGCSMGIGVAGPEGRDEHLEANGGAGIAGEGIDGNKW